MVPLVVPPLFTVCCPPGFIGRRAVDSVHSTGIDRGRVVCAAGIDKIQGARIDAGTIGMAAIVGVHRSRGVYLRPVGDTAA